ncbi:hypothetical protein BGX29_010052 [Mortierella sp. GBA35]|nr:hypothetical protein BGX23_003825 [Mortierella sp. AD031]KAF9093186.1 hypothetical protein BGX29_010052 [Mortierella sp. GBA35]KAG0211052.1 hypothetical protein BGX33_004541 [Mortierella sp. NVP41]
MTDNPYPVGTTVFAKLKGFPWWPARIENEAELPINVSSKKPKQRPIWPVFFFDSHDYGWFGTSELKAFDPVSAEKARSSLRTASHLRNALSEALDPSLLASRLSETTMDYDDDEEEDEPLEEETAPARKKATPKSKKAAKAEPAEKKRRASASDDQPAKGKPSKRGVPADDDEDEDEAPKTKKRAGAAGRGRMESDKRSVDDDISAADASNGRTRKSEEDAGDSGDHGRAKKKLRSGQPNERLLKLRHKLQKLLLVEGLSDEVLVQNLERADPILAEVEAFEIDLQMLKDTKIGRLMKKISALQFSRDPHQIVDRSVKLIKQYKSMMEKAQENGEAASPADKGVETTVATVTPVDKAAIAAQKPVGVEGVVSDGVKPQAPIVSSHILDVPPAPEAVVAAVAAIVGTNTHIPPAVAETKVTEVSTVTTTEATMEVVSNPTTL